MSRFQPRTTIQLVAAFSALMATAGMATSQAAEETPATADLQRQIDELNRRLQAMETKPPQAHEAKGTEWASGLSFGAYGESKFGLQQNPADNGRWQNGFDGARMALLPSFQASDRILFKAEIDVEHAGIAFDDDDKLGGAVEVEQAYIDITFNEYLHWRLPGIDIVPFGYTNVYHEPIFFYSVDRPDLANSLIPTTWFGGSTSVHGQVTNSLAYQFQISTTIIDSGGNVRDTTDANGPAVLGYPAGVSGTEALALTRATSGDFKQQSNQIAYALRLAYQVADIDGLAGSTSVYVSPDISPRGAYASDVNNVKIGELGRSPLAMADTELRYRPNIEGIEVRAEGVGLYFASPENLRANNDGDTGNNVGSTMWGTSGELAWHYQVPDNGWEIVPFMRYTHEVLQTSGFSGLDDNQPTGAGRKEYYTIGMAAFPIPSVVLKIDYRAIRDGSSDGPQSDHLLGGVGFFF